MVLLNTHCTGYWYFKDLSIVFTNTSHFYFTTARPNKNNNNNNNKKKKKKKKKMEKFGYFTECQKLLKQLSKVPAIVRITKQYLKDIFLTRIKNH